MKASAFRYVKPATLAAALDLLAGDAEAVPLGGGQSLLAMLNLRVTSPSLLVDLGALAELQGIAVDGGTLRIGASSRHREVMRSALVREHAPLLAAALEHVAHPAVRNRGTIGGSLALADPAAEMPACVTVLQAEIVLVRPGGRRSVAAEAFFTGLMQTALEPGEIIAGIHIPLARPRWAFRELARRHGDYALAGLAATAGRFVYFGCSDHAQAATTVAALANRGPMRHDDPALLDALRTDLGEHDTPGLRGGTRLRLAAALTCDVMADLRA